MVSIHESHRRCSRWAGRVLRALVLLFALPGGAGAEEDSEPGPARRWTTLQVQAHAMAMADEYGAALGEAMYLAARSPELGTKGRWLALSFLRNGMGAAIDIAAGSNPNVAVLDLLVLGALQTWAFGKHWIPAGIAERPGHAALERLKRAEGELWRAGARFLDGAQIVTLKRLVRHWIDAHPERTVVSLVRFAEFTDRRRMPAVMHDEASGLLSSVQSASAAVEDATLLGERVLWFASRLPYVLGQQAELTAYRIADQPEAELARASLESMNRIADAIAQRMSTLDKDLVAQQSRFFKQLGAERAAALEDLAARIGREREATISLAFDRLAQERNALIDQVAARQTEMVPVMSGLRDVLESSDGLARNLTETVRALDVLVARFERAPESDGPPLDFDELRGAAVEIGAAADRLTTLIRGADEALRSPALVSHLERAEAISGDLADRLFWRGAALIAILLAGLVLLRRIPVRLKTV